MTTMTAPHRNGLAHDSTTKSGPSVTKMVITPAMAERFLASNHENNRSVSKVVVRRYADDMRDGRWKLTHEGIAFNRDGVLVDGQHRLHAIVAADIPIEAHVWNGVDDSSMLVVDSGKARTAHDAIQIGLGDSWITRDVTAVGNAMYRGMRVKVDKLTNSALLEFVTRHRSAIEFVQGQFPSTRTKLNTTNIRAVVARAWYTSNREDLKSFCVSFVSGACGEERRDLNIVLLRNYLLDSSGGRGTRRSMEIYFKVERALKAYLDDEHLNRLYPVSREMFPIPGDED